MSQPSQPSDDNDGITLSANLPDGVSCEPEYGNTVTISDAPVADAVPFDILPSDTYSFDDTDTQTTLLIIPVPKTERAPTDSNRPKGDKK